MMVLVSGELAKELLEKSTIKDEKLRVEIKSVTIDYTVYEPLLPWQLSENTRPLYTNLINGIMVTARGHKMLITDTYLPEEEDYELIKKELSLENIVYMDPQDEISKDEIVSILMDEPFGYSEKEAKKILNMILNSNAGPASEFLIVSV